MNGNQINSGAINARVGFASIVYLPSATVEIELRANERIYVSMVGSTGMGMSPSGDISKVSNLGSATNAMGLAVNGSLTLNRRIYFDSSTLGMGITLNGNPQTVSRIPSGSVNQSFATSGQMIARSVMSGSIDKSFTVTGQSTNFVNFGSQVIKPGISLSGALIANRYLSGDSTIQLMPAGDLAKGVRVSIGSGVTGIDLTAAGALRKTARMAGGITVSMAPTGSLAKGVRIPIGSAPSVQSMSMVGNLRQTIRFTGVTNLGLDAVGSIISRRVMQGAVATHTSLVGDLSNNAQAMDLGRLLMIRKPTNREMTR
jgi:hypothetical protein